MPAPLLPLLLLGGAAVAVAMASSQKKPPRPAPFPDVPPQPAPLPSPTPPGSKTYTLDTNMPPELRDQVLAALATVNDRATLEAFAASLAPNYPLAAAALRLKAAMLPAPAPLPAQPAPNVGPTPQPVPPPPIEPGPPTPTPISPPQPMPIPSVPTSLDANMSTDMIRAVLGALTTETDPAKLQGFAQSIQALYPIAAGLLMAKANALLLSRGGGIVPTPAIPVPPIVPRPPSPSPSPTPIAPVPTNGTYTVQSGDYPIKIAQKLVHDASRWRELVAANPQKKRAPDGNFATLLPGEVLSLPASWTAPVPMLAHPPLLTKGGRTNGAASHA